MAKFEFDTDFQFEILKYTLQHPEGYKIVNLYSEEYFTLIEHAILAKVIKDYYKSFRKVPGKAVYMEELRKTLQDTSVTSSLLESELNNVRDLARDLFRGAIKDPEYIVNQTEKFAQYLDLKDTIENMDILDFNKYHNFSEKVSKAISPRVIVEDLTRSFLIGGLSDRQLMRRDVQTIFPTPFRQINKLTNAGGYPKGATIVIVDRPKKKKTAFLVNVIVGYLKMGKKVLVVDLENGEEEYMARLEQCMSNKTKMEILSGDYDKDVKKTFRKYKRLGGEVVVRRMPALITNGNSVDKLICDLEENFGFYPNVLITDYMGKMGSNTGKEALSERISEAYTDISNVMLKHNIDIHWTANHVTRTGAKHERSRYVGEDIAGAIEIIRHANAAFGLNRTDEEEEAGIQRLEIIEHRDGVPKGRACFFTNMDTQRFKEMTTAQRKEFDEQFSQFTTEEKDKEATQSEDNRNGDL